VRTAAASGMARAATTRPAAEDMKVVRADIEVGALEETAFGPAPAGDTSWPRPPHGTRADDGRS
jgi:hypothetical protein